MSIANDYQAAADFVAGYAHRREPIPEHAAAHLAQRLLDLADKAKQLERLPVDDVCADADH